jgi:hypothetical protein
LLNAIGDVHRLAVNVIRFQRHFAGADADAEFYGV